MPTHSESANIILSNAQRLFPSTAVAGHHQRNKKQHSSSDESSYTSSDSDSPQTQKSSQKHSAVPFHRSIEEQALVSLLEDVRVQRLLSVYEILDENLSIYLSSEEHQTQSCEALQEVTESLSRIARRNRAAGELLKLCSNAHFKCLLSAHDDVVHRRYEPDLSQTSESESNDDEQLPQGHISSTRVTSVRTAPPKNAKKSSLVVTSTTQRAIESGDRTTTPDSGPAVVKRHASNASINRDSMYRATSVILRDRAPQTVTVTKDLNAPLGMTVTRVDSFVNGQPHSDIVVERILADSIVERQGVLQVGDAILAVNNMPVDSAEALLHIIRQIASNTFTMNIIPGPRRFIPQIQANDRFKTYIRAFFSYNPQRDSLLPVGNVGVPFEVGDILEVVNRDDAHYWQVRRLDNPRVGLVPSSTLEERRRSYCPQTADNKMPQGKVLRKSSSLASKKSKKNKKLFSVMDAPAFSEGTDIWSYEDVIQVPPMRTRCILLIGPEGVGRRSLKQLVCQMEPQKFAFPTPDSSQSQNTPRNKMEEDIKNGFYVEWHEVGGTLYGIRMDAVKEMIDQGKTVILDCQPKAVRTLRQPVFNPHVVFIAAPTVDVMKTMQQKALAKGLNVTEKTEAELQEVWKQSSQYESLYRHLYQSVLLNDDLALTANRLVRLVRRLERQPQWIPLAWEEDLELAAEHRLAVLKGELPAIMSAPPTLNEANTFESQLSSSSSGRQPGPTGQTRGALRRAASEERSDSSGSSRSSTSSVTSPSDSEDAYEMRHTPQRAGMGPGARPRSEVKPPVGRRPPPPRANSQAPPLPATAPPPLPQFVHNPRLSQAATLKVSTNNGDRQGGLTKGKTFG